MTEFRVGDQVIVSRTAVSGYWPAGQRGEVTNIYPRAPHPIWVCFPAKQPGRFRGSQSFSAEELAHVNVIDQLIEIVDD